jgi:hypothetical protein
MQIEERPMAKQGKSGFSLLEEKIDLRCNDNIDMTFDAAEAYSILEINQTQREFLEAIGLSINSFQFSGPTLRIGNQIFLTLDQVYEFCDRAKPKLFFSEAYLKAEIEAIKQRRAH